MQVKAAVFLLTGLLLLLPFSAATGQGNEVSVVIPPGTGSNPAEPGYTPDTITIALGVNNTVVWLNNDTVPHTVTPSTEPASGNWSVGSGNLNPGQSYKFTFTVPGRYTYACAYHSFMHGTVVVKAGSMIPEFPTSSMAAVLFIAIMGAAFVLQRSRLGTGSFSRLR